MPRHPYLALAVALAAAPCPALAQTAELPPEVRGSWDVSAAACAQEGTGVTRIDIGPGTIDTFGGTGTVAEVEVTGPVTFAAVDFVQLEGVETVEPATREYFRFTQRDGGDRMTLIWQGVQTVDLVRCGAAPSPEAQDTGPAPSPTAAGPLPLRAGLFVLAGDDCDAPGGAAWRVYDGAGLHGASSRSCVIGAATVLGGATVLDQTCTAAYDGSESRRRDVIAIEAPRRFTLLEEGEAAVQAFDWCGPRLRP